MVLPDAMIKPQGRADWRRADNDVTPPRKRDETIMDGAKADGAGGNFRALVFALLALACGHMLSTLLRTIPAISLDVMAADFGTSPQKLGSLTSIYHFAFVASQIP